MGIKIARNLTLPDAAVTYKAGLLGRTGSGKTNTAVVIAEQMIEKGFPVAIIDPQGDWWGLRSKYQIAILGGEHADIPLEPSGGTVAADFLINERIPVLFDLFTMGENDMVRFAADFAKRLWQANKEALHIFLDEADLFAPQNLTGKGHKAVCLGAWQNIVRRGRSRGLGCTMITQRSSVINKDLLTQADPLFVHRLTAPQDLAAVKLYLDYHGQSKEQIRETLSDVAKLKVGECYVISPGTLEIDPKKLSVQKRKSFDSSATPVTGESLKEPRSFADVDLSFLQQQMSDTIERAKANDPKELKREVARLKKELSSRKPVTDEKAIERAVAARDKHWQGEIRKIEKSRQSLAGKLTKIHDLSQLNGDASVSIEAPPKADKRPIRPERTVRSKRERTPQSEDTTLAKGERIVLIVAAQYEYGATREQISILTGYKRSTRDSYIQRLKEKGFVETTGSIQATDEGIEALGNDYEPLPTGDDLREYWLERLPEGERVILEVLIEDWPHEVQRIEFDDRTDYKRSTRDAYIQRLKARQLVSVGSGTVRASEILFDE